MTPERIAELRALADAATPGPWRRHSARGYVEWIVGAEFDDQELRPGPCSVGVVAGASSREDVEDVLIEEPDAAFVTEARTAVPELLDEVERLRRQLVSALVVVADHDLLDELLCELSLEPVDDEVIEASVAHLSAQRREDIVGAVHRELLDRGLYARYPASLVDGYHDAWLHGNVGQVAAHIVDRAVATRDELVFGPTREFSLDKFGEGLATAVTRDQ